MTETVRRVASCTLLLAPALPLAGQGNTTATTSFVQVDTTYDTPVSQQVDTYSLQLIARMLGGPLLYDQLFSVPFADPLFQAAIGAAQGVLTGNGATAFLGPTLQSTSSTLVGSVSQTVLDNLVTSQLVGVLTTIGPNTVTISDLGICQSYVLGVGPLFSGPYALPSGCTLAGQSFVAPAGTTNFDARTLTLNDSFTTTTTTNTYLTTQSYEIVGVPAAVPEPATVGLFAVGLGAWLAARRRFPLGLRRGRLKR